jgi:TonB family protein
MLKAAIFILLVLIFSIRISAQDPDATWSGWSMQALTLRATPAPDGKVVCTAKPREDLLALRKHGDWNLVRAKSCTGWVIRNSVGVRTWNRDKANGSQAQSTVQGGGIGSGQGSGRGVGYTNGRGSGSGDGSGNAASRITSLAIVQPLKIISKPKALYTDAAKTAQIQGTVTLRITFLATGQIGGISVIKGQPYGLTEQAIAAARAIKFEPARTKDGPITVTRALEFPFVIY